MTDLGNMVISFSANIDNLASGITAAKDHISGLVSVSANWSKGIVGDLEKVGGGMLGLAGGALSTLTQGVVGNFGLIKDQFSAVLDESISAQEGMSQTEAVIKSTGDASGMTANQIADMAGNLSHLTTFSDDAIQSGENMLMTFTGIGKDVFPQATKTMLDLSQAMGQDVKSSAIQLGKALNDPLTGMSALQRVGVTFDDTEQKQIKTMMAHNDIVGAQNVMLKELQKEFGDSAEAAGKTFGGQLVILQQYLADVRQEIGDKLLPVVTHLLGFITQTALPGIEDFGANAVTYLGNIFKSLNLTDFNQAWQAIGDEIGSITNKFKGLGEAMGTDADPLAEFIGQLMHAGLDTITTILYDISEGFMAIDKGLQDGSLAKMLGEVFDIISQAHGFLETIEGDLVKFAGGLIEAALQSGAFQSVLHTVHDLLPDVSAFVKRLGSDLDENLLPPLKSLIENVGTTVKNFSDWLDKSGTAKMAIGLLGDAVDKTTGLIGKLVEWTSDAVGWLNKGGPAANLVRDAILGIGAAIVAIKLGEFVTNQVVGFVNHAKDAASAAVEWGGKLKDLGGNIMDVAGKIKDSLVAAFDWAKGKIKGDTEEMSKSLDGVKQSEEDVGNTAKGEMAKDVETGAKSSEKSLKGVETEAGNVEAKETDIGTTAKDTMAQDVETGAQSSEKSLKGIETQAQTDVTKEEAVGTTAKTTMATDVEEGATLAAGPKGLQQIETQATTDVEKEIAIGTTAKTTMATDIEEGSALAAGESGLGAISGAAFGVLGILGMISTTFMNWQNGIISDAGFNLGEWLAKHTYAAPPSPPSGNGSIGTGPRTHGGFAEGGADIPAGYYKVGERGDETMYVPDHSTIYPHGISPLAGGGEIHVHNHLYMDGREITNQVMTRAMKELRRQGVKVA